MVSLLKLLYVFPLVLFPIAQAQSQIQFEDATSTAGPFHQGESWGSTWGDVNGDGWPDVFATNHGEKNSIWVNNQDGTLSDKSLEVDGSGVWTASPNADTHGTSFVDFDGDGDDDLYVSVSATGLNQFLVNENGVLIDYSAQYDPAVPRSRARGPAWFDFTNDGLLDFIMASAEYVGLYEQSPSGFIDITTDAGIACNKSFFNVFVDVTGDSRLELICGNSKFPKKIYETSGIPFIDVTNKLPATSWTLDVAMADINGDLKQDFFIVRGQKRHSEALKTGDKRLEAHMIVTRNEEHIEFVSDGTITIDITWTHPYWKGSIPEKIFIGTEGWNPATEVFTVSFDDPNVAGIKAHTASDVGMFIGYDKVLGVWKIDFSPGGVRNMAYLKITSDTTVSQVAISGIGSGDVPMKPTLLVSSPSGYKNVASAAGVGAQVKCISAAAQDFDNDKDIDLYLVCRGGVQNISNILYENLGDGTFSKVVNAGGAEGPLGAAVSGSNGTGENVTVADYDVDGFVDLFVTNGLNMVPKRQGGPINLFRNLGNENHWVEIDLEGSGLGASNRDAIGAKVFATSGGVTQVREQNGGFHRWAQNHQRIHFGLGSDTKVDLQVEWPNGLVESFSNLTVDCLYRISEGTGIEGITIGSSTCGGAAPLSINVDDISVGEGAGTAVYTVSLSSATDKVVTVDYSTIDGSAEAGSDYTSTAGTVTFGIGETSKVVIVPILQDSSSETSETFTLVLSNATNAMIGGGNGVGTIFDDDASACGRPAFDATTEKGIFLWKQCDGGSSDWFMRVTGGGYAGKSAYIGSVDLNQSFLIVTGTSLEANDTVDSTTDSTRLDFILKVWNNGVDGVDFTYPAGTQACFTATALPVGAQVYVGAAKTPMISPFDMETLLQCGISGLPPQCGKPTYDRRTEKGVFLWKQCDGGDSDWFMRVLGGGDSSRSIYEGSLNLNQDFVSVTAINKEANDTLEYAIDPTRMDFLFYVWGSGYDGVNFTYPAGSSACFDAASLPANAPVYIGVNRLPVTPPIDLESLVACQ